MKKPLKKSKVILIGVIVILAVSCLSWMKLNEETGFNKWCKTAINEYDYQEFEFKKCTFMTKYTKDDFIKACENAGRVFYDSECMTREDYDEEIEEERREEEEYEEYKRKRSECEADGKVWYGSSCKTKEEADRLEAENKKRIEAEEKAKAEEEKKKAEEEKKKAEEEKKKAEEEKKKTEEKKTENKSKTETSADDGTTLPSDIEPGDIISLCNRTLKSVGIKSGIKLTNSYPMGEPKYIFVIVGTVNGKMAQCQANWKYWTVKSLTVDGKRVY